MCGISNTRAARAANDLRVTAGGHSLFVIVMWDHTEGSNDRGRGIRMVDRGFLFQRNESFKICRLISQESLSRSVIERYYIYIFFLMKSIREKRLLSIIVTPSQRYHTPCNAAE